MLKRHKNRLFITGMLRTGTTLLDKLLNAHPFVTIASQPFFRLFTYIKEKYHLANGVDLLPLSPLFCEPLHLRQNLARYLEKLILNESDISCLRQGIAETNRQWSPAITHDRMAVLAPGTFFEVLEQGIGLIDEIYGSHQTRIVGLKEVVCEEFIPILLGRGYKVIIVCRDPRAVISSASTGRYEEYVGKIRPILFNIRIWRKSVAHAIALRGNHDFRLVKYEDLVFEPTKTLRGITDFLGVEPFGSDLRLDDIKDQNGSLWKGNSSYGDFDGLGTVSHLKWKENLSEDEISLIEYCCCGEMGYLEYEFSAKSLSAKIEEFSEFRPLMRENYAMEHYLGPENVAREKKRISYLTGDSLLDQKLVYDYFFNPDVFEVLHSSFSRVMGG